MWKQSLSSNGSRCIMAFTERRNSIFPDVVATARHRSHTDQKLLLVVPLDLEDNVTGAPYVAVDSVAAGPGDRVLLATDGWAAMTAVNRPQSPVDDAVIGIIHRLDLVEDAIG